MYDIKLRDDNQIILYVDTKIYNDNVISKVLYWLSEDYIISRKYIAGSENQKICFNKINGIISEEEFCRVKKRLNHDFIDFKTRQIIDEETKDLRNILIVKAFANRDDFIEFDFSDKQ